MSSMSSVSASRSTHSQRSNSRRKDVSATSSHKEGSNGYRREKHKGGTSSPSSDEDRRDKISPKGPTSRKEEKSSKKEVGALSSQASVPVNMATAVSSSKKPIHDLELKLDSIKYHISEQDCLGDSLQDDALILLHHFKEEMDDSLKKMKKPNVLITGVTGAGKSSLINAVFGNSIAKVGCGVPVTQHFTKYENPSSNVVIYDSKGLEHGENLQFIDETRKFFSEHQSNTKGTPGEPIHVIWYIVNSASARFEPFEETLCRTIFSSLPFLIILNKADLSSEAERKALKDVIFAMDFPNFVGIFETIACTQQTTKTIDVCPRCGSEDIVIRKKLENFKCRDCKFQDKTRIDNGLERIIKATIEVLPIVVRDSFISSQKISTSLKNQRCCKIIREFHKDYEAIRLPASLFKLVANTLTRISIVWEFREHGHLYGVQIAKDIISSFKFRDKLFLLTHKHQERVNVISAIICVWARCLRQLHNQLLALIVGMHSERQITEQITFILNSVFAHLREEVVLDIESRLPDSSLEDLVSTDL